MSERDRLDADVKLSYAELALEVFGWMHRQGAVSINTHPRVRKELHQKAANA